jgi:serine/threonine-protein kinase
MKLAEYMGALGTPFEAFLSNDSGNRSYSYATPNGPRWIKVLNLQQTPLSDLQGIIDVYNGLRSALVPRKWRLVQLTDGVVMEHDWVPGIVLRSPEEDRSAPASAYQRFIRLSLDRRLSVYDQILQLFLEIERQDIIVEDFYDGCILYDFATDIAHVCDLDHIHRGPYLLTKDRQYGSSRFMAPEEWRRGSLIDHRTNVYTMGATGFVLLNDNRRLTGEWPLSKASYRTLERATSETKEHRQESVDALYREWRQATSRTQHNRLVDDLVDT